MIDNWKRAWMSPEEQEEYNRIREIATSDVKRSEYMTEAELIRLLAMYLLATIGGFFTMFIVREQFGIIGAIILLCIYAKIFCSTI